MTSRPESTLRSAERVRRAAVVSHGKPARIGDALERLRRIAVEHEVELVEPDDGADLAIVLGGDGTMLRALTRFLGTRTPVLGVNFGSVGFLTSIRPDELEQGFARVFAGDYVVLELPTLRLDVPGVQHAAVNDVVLRSATLGRMIHLSWGLGDEDLGRVPCDGVVCATPTGSTAYNLSNGGPVLVWGLQAMAVSFLAPHSLHVRPLVVPHGLELRLENLTSDVAAAVLVDGHAAGELGSGDVIHVSVDDRPSRLATLPEVTFFRRYRDVFAH